MIYHMFYFKCQKCTVTTNICSQINNNINLISTIKPIIYIICFLVVNDLKIAFYGLIFVCLSTYCLN